MSVVYTLYTGVSRLNGENIFFSSRERAFFVKITFYSDIRAHEMRIHILVTEKGAV